MQFVFCVFVFCGGGGGGGVLLAGTLPNMKPVQNCTFHAVDPFELTQINLVTLSYTYI